MPTLIAKHQKKTVATSLKKAYSVVNQAMSMTVAEQGDYENWMKECGFSYAPTCTVEDIKEWCENTLCKYIQLAKSEIDEESFVIYLNDGTKIFISRHIRDTMVVVPLMGKTQVEGKNAFNFRFITTEKHDDASSAYHKLPFEPYAYAWNGTRDGLKAGNVNACSKTGNKAYCSKLIQYDGWEIKDDYPW